MEARLSFQGTGGSLFGRFFGGAVLTLLTLGLFLPWYLLWLARWTFENSRLSTPAGEMRFDFNGSGPRLLGLMLVNALLTVLTLGFYTPWAVVEALRYAADGATARGADTRPWRLRFDGTGGEAFPILLKGFVFGILTLGIYLPWFLCALARWMAARTRIERDGAPTGTVAFDGAGGELLVTFVIGTLLTMVTWGIYTPWFQVSMWRHFAGHTKVTVDGVAWTGDFSGTGWDWALQLVIGFALTFLTLGIYLPWFVARQARFRMGNTRFLSPRNARPA
jgi:uncharacterized membrane protein YjgN (DUF898 family)